MTVRELKDILSKFDEESAVYIFATKTTGPAIISSISYTKVIDTGRKGSQCNYVEIKLEK